MSHSHFNATRQTEFLGHLAEGLNPEQAASLVGVSLRTVQRRRAADAEFEARYQDAQDRLPTEGELLKLVAMKARSGNLRATEILLRHVRNQGEPVDEA